jgi:hypothetical protein
MRRDAGTSGIDSLPQLDGDEILTGRVYDFEELDRLDSGMMPSFVEEVPDIGNGATPAGWDIGSLLLTSGVSSIS